MDREAVAPRRLPCGADPEELVAQVLDGAPPRNPGHQRTCPHCRAFLAELRALWEPVLELEAERVHAPPGLLEQVMARVRALPRTTWHAVVPTEQGETRIAARVVGAVARLAALEVPSVTLALGGGRTVEGATAAQVAGPDGEPATEVGVAGSRVVVDVHVVVSLGTHVPSAGARVREVVARRIAEMTGLTASEVNVEVVDVHDGS